MSEQDDWRGGGGLSRWEQECSDLVDESESSIEAQIAAERDAIAQRLFLLFQSSATSVAELYKECQSGVRLWASFQNAASAVTSLYKECVESQKRQHELAVQFGSHRRNKDVLSWAHKRKRTTIRREDLISYLSGRNPRLSPPNQGSRSSGQWGSPRRFDVQRGLTCLSLGGASAESSVAAHSAGNVISVDDDDLGTFREALALSAFTVGAASGAHHSASPRASKTADLNHFITEEFARHGRKRSHPSIPVVAAHHAPVVGAASGDDLLKGAAAPDDVIMDSPQNKRPKFL